MIASAAAAVLCFAAAAFIDSPWPSWPREGERYYGNFFCSLGWCFLALAILLHLWTG